MNTGPAPLAETAIVRLLDLRVPLVQAQAGSPSGTLASTLAGTLALARAGGLGVVPGMTNDAESSAVLEALRAEQHPFAIRLDEHPHGAAWHDTMNRGPVPAILAATPPVPAMVAAAQANGTLYLSRVASVAEAVQSVRAGADGLWVGGDENLALLRAVARALPAVPLVADTTVTDPAGLAAVLAAGGGAAMLDTNPASTGEAVTRITSEWVNGPAAASATGSDLRHRDRRERESAALRANLRRRKKSY